MLFFFKQKTAYDMRISDWSSDVCSSDLFSHTDGETAMNNHRSNYQDNSEETVMSEEVEFLDDELEGEPEERAFRSRAFNLNMRHRIEDRLEQRRLMKELGDYESQIGRAHV